MNPTYFGDLHQMKVTIFLKSIVLHQVTLLFGILFNLLTSLQDASLVAELLKALLKLLGSSLIGIIFYGYRLVRNRGLDTLDTLLKTEVALNLVLTSRTVHLRGCCENHSLEVGIVILGIQLQSLGKQRDIEGRAHPIVPGLLLLQTIT